MKEHIVFFLLHIDCTHRENRVNLWYPHVKVLTQSITPTETGSFQHEVVISEDGKTQHSSCLTPVIVDCSSNNKGM